MINKELIEQLNEIEEKIADAANSLLSEIHTIEPIYGYSHLCYKEIDGEYISYFGEEFWRYGGYESHSHELPTKLLYDKEFKEKYISNLKDKKVKERIAKKARKQKEKQEKIEKDKAQYERLKKQFEGK